MRKKAKLEIKCLAKVKAITTVVRPRSDPSANKEKGNEPKVSRCVHRYKVMNAYIKINLGRRNLQQQLHKLENV